jgi:hypothetical protein
MEEIRVDRLRPPNHPWESSSSVNALDQGLVYTLDPLTWVP